MSEFVDALVSSSEESAIPKEYDWFTSLIGDWNFTYTEPGSDRIVEGEWLFRRVLEGRAIEDLFICPSRKTVKENPQPDGEYGMAVRMFRPELKGYDMTYICAQYTTSLEVHKDGDKIVCTVKKNPAEKWVFSEITMESFRWQNITVKKDGTWRANSNIIGKRKI